MAPAGSGLCAPSGSRRVGLLSFLGPVLWTIPSDVGLEQQDHRAVGLYFARQNLADPGLTAIAQHHRMI